MFNFYYQKNKKAVFMTGFIIGLGRTAHKNLSYLVPPPYRGGTGTGIG